MRGRAPAPAVASLLAPEVRSCSARQPALLQSRRSARTERTALALAALRCEVGLVGEFSKQSIFYLKEARGGAGWGGDPFKTQALFWGETAGGTADRSSASST